MPVAFLFEDAPSVTTTEKEATNFLHTLDFIKMVHNAAGDSDSVDNHFREAAASRLSIANNVITKRRVSSLCLLVGFTFLLYSCICTGYVIQESDVVQISHAGTPFAR